MASTYLQKRRLNHIHYKSKEVQFMYIYKNVDVFHRTIIQNLQYDYFSSDAFLEDFERRDIESCQRGPECVYVMQSYFTKSGEPVYIPYRKSFVENENGCIGVEIIFTKNS